MNMMHVRTQEVKRTKNKINYKLDKYVVHKKILLCLKSVYYQFI